MYMPLTSSVILRPTKETTEMLGRYEASTSALANSHPSNPSIGQERRDPYYNVFGGYRAVTRYISALKYSKSTKKCWKTIFVTDSGQVIKEVRNGTTEERYSCAAINQSWSLANMPRKWTWTSPFLPGLCGSSINEAKGNKSPHSPANARSSPNCYSRQKSAILSRRRQLEHLLDLTRTHRQSQTRRGPHNRQGHPS